MTNEEIKSVTTGDRLILYRRDPDGAVVPVTITVAAVTERGRCKVKGPAYDAAWCLVKDEVGRTRVLESDEYLKGLGHPTHEGGSRVAGAESAPTTPFASGFIWSMKP